MSYDRCMNDKQSKVICFFFAFLFTNQSFSVGLLFARDIGLFRTLRLALFLANPEHHNVRMC